METVGSPPADAELHLLPDLGDLTGRAPAREASVFSVAAHAALIVGLALVPPSAPPPAAQPVRQRVTPLIEPPTVLTQRTPNPGKASKEFKGALDAPRVRVPAPPAPPPSPTRTPPQQAVIPAMPPPAPTAPPAAPPPPPVTAPETPKVEAPQLPVPPPPQIQAEEKSRNPFERPGAPVAQVPRSQSQIPIPDPGAPIRGGAAGAPGGAAGSQGMSPGSIQLGQGGSLELPALLSDPQGVDFKPYLTRLLATVKRNWMTVWPESAKSGRRGRVGVQFSIAKDGTVTKVVWAFQSGADALDRAAVAAISMSNPFPPLPGEFKGERIVLQFNFAYNMTTP